MDIDRVVGTSTPQNIPYFEEARRKLNSYGLYEGVSEKLCKELTDKLRELCRDEKDYNDLLEFLNILAEADIKTVEHSIRVGLLCDQIAQLLNIERKSLVYPGLLHDMGKCRIPKSILQKTEDFDEKEREVMKEHPYYTFIIVGKRFKYSGLMGHSHHMHQNNGYPKSLPELDVPYSNETLQKNFHESKILAIADFFDAAVSRKNNKYGKNILTVEEAAAKLKEDKPELEIVINQINQANIFYNHMNLVNIDIYQKTDIIKA